ncbi:MAG: Na/Pi cotransporter family protein [Terrimicrobiaceae bacterium]
MSDFLIIGGIALTIFGARFLRKGMDRLFGNRMMCWFANAAEKPHHAILGGLVAGVMVPSSTGLSLAALHLTENRQISVRRIILILLAAHAGTTLTVQLLAFNLQGLAGLFLFIGLLMFQFLRREALRGIGQCLLSVGFIFLAMRLIGEGARQAIQQPEIKELITILGGHPVIISLMAAVVVVLLQSSTATISLLLAYAASGVSDPVLMLPWVAGVNVGICVTTLLAGWSTEDGRRIGFGALTVKAFIAILLLSLPAASLWIFGMMPGSLARQVAMSHTLINVVAILLMLPLGLLVEKWTYFLVPRGGSLTGGKPESLLDEGLLDTPALALSRALRQTLRMADGTRGMLEHFWTAYKQRDVVLAREIQTDDDNVDRMNFEIADYLSRICDGKTPPEMRQQVLLLSFCNDLESIGDIVEKHLCDLLLKILQENIGFTREDRAYLDEAYRLVLVRFEAVCGFISSGNRQEARALVARREELAKWFDELQMGHHTRMSTSATPKPLDSSIYLDFLNAFRRINSHLTSIARNFSGTERGGRKRNAAEDSSAK